MAHGPAAAWTGEHQLGASAGLLAGAQSHGARLAFSARAVSEPPRMGHRGGYLRDVLPGVERPRRGGRPPRLTHRISLPRTGQNFMSRVLATGAPWRDMLERYGPWQTVATRFYGSTG